MKYYVIANPAAGKKEAIKKSRVVYKMLYKNNIESSIIISRYEGNITEVTKKLSENGKCRFFVVGGDGTVNEAIKGIIGTESEIAIIPAGTGNDFLRSVSDFRSLRKIVKGSLKNDVRKVDVIKDTRGNYSLNILNVGFDATVASNMNKFRNIPFLNGTMKYNLAIFYSLFRNKNYNLKIRVDDKIYKGKYTLVALANGKYYGSGIMPVPNAKLDDGLISVCMIEKTSIFEKIKLLPKYKKGDHLDLKQVKMEEGRCVSIVSNEKFDASYDGQMKKEKYVKCEILDKKVNVVYTKM